ncbi:MAG: DUF4340 domain-containing protein [Bacteroidales bacterium]|nr:DUF4340 domain-containing protein [Bacteroidales bacterium]MDY0054536.1 DUF4340 domain-containing protein [Bacteroidales bacterium]
MKLNRKQKNLIGLLSIIILITISLVVVFSQKSSTIEQNFHIKDTNKITKIVIEDREKNISKVVKQDSIWMVNDKFQASPLMVSTMLETLREMRIREPVAKAAHENIIKQLSARNTRIDVYTESYFINLGFIKLFKREKLEKSIYIGNETMDNTGTFMLIKGTKDPCVIHIPNFRGYLSSRFTAVENDWKMHTIFKYKPQDIASIKVEIPDYPQEGFELYAEENTFHIKRLADGELLKDFDTLKVTAFISSFFELNFENIATNIPQIHKDTIFSKNPSFVFTVKDKAGKEKKLKTFIKMNEGTWVSENDKTNFYEIFDINRMYGLMDGSSDTLILQYFAFDNIIKPVSYFYDAN